METRSDSTVSISDDGVKAVGTTWLTFSIILITLLVGGKRGRDERKGMKSEVKSGSSTDNITRKYVVLHAFT